MASGLSFSGNGGATAPISGLINQAYTVLEAYICTKNNAAQTIFSYGSGQIQSGAVTEATTYSLYLNAQGQICFSIWLQLGSYISGATTTTYTATPVTDGKPHQISFYIQKSTSTPQLFIDSINIASVSQVTTKNYTNSLVQTYLHNISGGQTDTGGAFGVDAFNSNPFAPAFIGDITEMRIWGGAVTGYILNPSFVINYNIPVDPKSSDLLYYWPFWQNPNTGLNDLVGNVALTLGQGVTTVSTIPQIYDDLSDVITNYPPSDFNEFSTGTQLNAFNALMKAIGSTAGYTPATFRNQYMSLTTPSTFSNWSASIKGAQYNSNDNCTKADFEIVQTALVNELTAIGELCNYYSQMEIINQTFSNQYYSAAEAVYAAAMSTSIVADMTLTNQQTSFNIGDVVNAVAGAVSAAGPEGKAVGNTLKVVWAVATMFSGNSPVSPVLNCTISIEPTIETMQSAANEIVVNMNKGLTTSLGQIAQNAGLLQAVVDKINNGSGFAASPAPSAADLNALYNAAVLFMVKILVCSGFKLYKVAPTSTDMYGGSSGQSVSVQQQDSLFCSAYTSPISGGTSYTVVGYYVSSGYNGYPTVYSLPQTYDTMVNTAAQNLCGQNMTTAEVFSWPYAQVSC